MRAVMIPLALAASLSLPLAAQNTRFIKVDIVSKTMMQHHMKHRDVDGPTEVHIRMPISLAKGVLDMVGDGEIKVNGETRKGMKGDHVRVTIE